MSEDYSFVHASILIKVFVGYSADGHRFMSSLCKHSKDWFDCPTKIYFLLFSPWKCFMQVLHQCANEHHNICLLGEIIKMFILVPFFLEVWQNILATQDLLKQALLYTVLLHLCIAPDNMLYFFSFNWKSTDIFLISPWKQMLWVHVRSASSRHFLVPTTYVFVEK